MSSDELPPPLRPPVLTRQTHRGTDYNWLWRNRRHLLNTLEGRRLIVNTFYTPTLSPILSREMSDRNKSDLIQHRRQLRTVMRAYKRKQKMKLEEALRLLARNTNEKTFSHIIMEYL